MRQQRHHMLAKTIAAALVLSIGLAPCVTGCSRRASDGANASTEQPVPARLVLAGRSHVSDQGWTDAHNRSKITLGKSSEDAILDAFSISVSDADGDAGISYQASLVGQGWQAEQHDGEQVGSDTEAVQIAAVKIWLTGSLADEYDVWYRAWIAGYGWLGWTNNGAESGSTSPQLGLNAVQVRLIEKGAAAPKNDAFTPEEGTSVENESALEGVTLLTDEVVEAASKRPALLSGNEVLDSYTERLIAEHAGEVEGEEALRNIYEYIAQSYSYVKENEYPQGSWDTWSISYAKEMFENGCGNCYRYASLLCWSARRLGYDAQVISGEVPWHGVLSPHGWVEITVDGVPYVCDSDLHKFVPGHNFFMVTYEEAPIEYHKL